MRSLLGAVIVTTFLSIALQAFQAQTAKNSSTCPPPPQARNKAEGLTIEAFSNKQGCLTRDPKTGLLMVVNKDGIMFKPVIPSSPATALSIADWSTMKGISSNGSQELAGTWSITSGTYPGEAELGLIRATGPQDIHPIEGVPLVDVKTERVTFAKKPGGQYCGAAFGANEVCLSKTGPTSYELVIPKMDAGTKWEIHSDGRTLRGKRLWGDAGAGSLLFGQAARN
jgi:hypothetical protein